MKLSIFYYTNISPTLTNVLLWSLNVIQHIWTLIYRVMQRISFFFFFYFFLPFESSLILLHQYQDCSLFVCKNKTLAEGDIKEATTKLRCSKESHLHPNLTHLHPHPSPPATTYQQMKGEQNNFLPAEKQWQSISSMRTQPKKK